MRLRICLMLISVLTTAVLAGAQGTPPAKDSKAKAEQGPFDEKADAKAALQTALQRAKKDNRRVLIEWGHNANDGCVLLHKSFKTHAGLSRKRLYEFELIAIEVGPRNKNGELAKQFQAAVVRRGERERRPLHRCLDGRG